jgi:hypothetical protein
MLLAVEDVEALEEAIAILCDTATMQHLAKAEREMLRARAKPKTSSPRPCVAVASDRRQQ